MKLRKQQVVLHTWAPLGRLRCLLARQQEQQGHCSPNALKHDLEGLGFKSQQPAVLVGSSLNACTVVEFLLHHPPKQQQQAHAKIVDCCDHWLMKNDSQNGICVPTALINRHSAGKQSLVLVGSSLNASTAMESALQQ